MPTTRPPAKINLTLEIIGRRRNGFHELESIFLRVGLSDRLTMTAGVGPDDRLTLTGLPGAPVAGNLVLRAVDALRARAGVPLPAFDVVLEKHIPAGAGLGGGSSDAAYALKLAQAAWGIGLARDDAYRLAASLGSDVPFFYFDCGAAFVSGTGEVVEPVATAADGLAVVLVHPPIALSTARVFARYDDRAAPHARARLDFPSEFTTDALIDWAVTTPEPNDLWPAASSLEPSLDSLRGRLNDATRNRWLMSGSGSTLFALYPSVDAAVEAARSRVHDVAADVDGCRINVVDLVGPDPAWRFP